MGRHPFQVRHYSKRYPPAWMEEGVVMQLWNYVLCVASANVYDNPYLHCLIALEAMQCHPCKSIDFIVCVMTFMLNI